MQSSIISPNPWSDLQLYDWASPLFLPSLLLFPPWTEHSVSSQSLTHLQFFSTRNLHLVLAMDEERKSVRSQSEVLEGEKRGGKHWKASHFKPGSLPSIILIWRGTDQPKINALGRKVIRQKRTGLWVVLVIF